MSDNMVPFTVVSNTIGIGTNRYNIRDVMPGAYDYFWLVVVDRTSLTVVANAVTEDCSVVPSAVMKYDGNPKYILIVTSYNMNTTSQPMGELDTFIRNNGAGRKYNALQQVATTVKRINDTSYNYLMASVMGEKSMAIEAFSIGNATLCLPMNLISVDGFYTPESMV